MFEIDRSRPASLYVHIPFCSRKCAYCAFYSLPGRPSETIDACARKLALEIEDLASWIGRPFETVYFGGGNPGLLGPRNLLALARACCRQGRPREFTVEINPETLGPWIVPSLELVTRLSVGIQSLDGRVLGILGRNSSLGQTLDGLLLSQRLREETGVDLSYDLICCVPGAAGEGERDLERLFGLADIDHLSLYALTPERGTPLGDAVAGGRMAMASDDEQADILLGLWERIEARGLRHYEVSNFARPGRECRHNLVYWRLGQYVGLGPGAASTVQGPYRRIECPRDLGLYLGTPPWAGYEEERLGREEEFEEWALMGCRIAEGLSSEVCQRRFGFPLEGLSFPGYSFDGRTFAPGEEGFLLADAAAAYVVDSAGGALESAGRRPAG